jgi:hypothetical protein
VDFLFRFLRTGPLSPGRSVPASLYSGSKIPTRSGRQPDNRTAFHYGLPALRTLLSRPAPPGLTTPQPKGPTLLTLMLPPPLPRSNRLSLLIAFRPYTSGRDHFSASRGRLRRHGLLRTPAPILAAYSLTPANEQYGARRRTCFPVPLIEGKARTPIPPSRIHSPLQTDAYVGPTDRL